MVDTAILDLLSAAKGDQTQLTLLSVDICFAALPSAERQGIRRALEAAAVPHWCDDEMLAALLPEKREDAPTLMSLLRQLPVVESFPARGVGAANVHEASRIQLRQHLRITDPQRLHALSQAAAGHLGGNPSAHARMEVLYHRFTFEPERALEECDTLVAYWQHVGRSDVLLALAAALLELIDGDFVAGPVCAAACLHVAQVCYHYVPLGETERRAESALHGLQRGGAPWRLARAHTLLGDVRRDKGKPADALASYRAALAIRDRLGAKEFGNPRWRRDLSASHRKVGEVLANQGDLSGALAAYGEALKIIDTLATGKPDDPDLLHQRCVTHERLGDVKCMAGDPKGALAAYRDAQEVAESLVARDPNDPHWHRDLFTVYHRLGNVLRRARDFSGALKAYRNALATAERLATQDAGPAESVAGCPDGASVAPEAPLEKDIAPSATPPAVPSTDRVFAEMTNDADWQRNVSVAHQLIGDVLRDQKDFAGALSEYRADLAIAARLAATAPANKRWQHDLSVSHERIGDLLRKQEDFAGAADAYQAALAIRDDLARKDPSNAEWRRDFALSCGRMVTALLPQSTRRPGEIQRWLTRGFDSLASISREATSPEQEKVYAYLEDLRGKAAKARAAGADQPGGIILPTPTSSATPT